MKVEQRQRLARWKSDPVKFITEALINPETNKPFELYPAQVRFLREALVPLSDGALRFSEVLLGQPKKSGKTTLGALIVIYVIAVLGGPFAEAYCIANDFDQAQGRVFQAIVRVLQASPLLRDAVKILANRIEFRSTGATITAIASEYRGAAGANPTITVFDELWGYISESARRLWDEMVPVPTRKVSLRLTVTYAGYLGESKLLEELWHRGSSGVEVGPDLHVGNGMVMLWTTEALAPWQTPEWREQMRAQLRPTAYQRLIENRWVSAESSFIEAEQWDKCVDADKSYIPRDPGLEVWVGVDASVRRDSTAIVACAFDEKTKKVRLIQHKIFNPNPDNPIQFEESIELSLIALAESFRVREIRFDPYQMISVAQRLTKMGLPMVEYAQTLPHLTEMADNLYELVRAGNLVLYPDAEMRIAALRAVASESARGWKIAKEKQSHKIDVIVALAMAALGAVQQKGVGASYTVMEFWEGLNALRGGGTREGDDYGVPSYDVGFTDILGNPICTVGVGWRHG